MDQQVYFVGTESEVDHHAAPLRSKLDVKIIQPSAIDEIKPGDLAVFYSEHFDRFRDAITQLQQRNIATLYMIDGILEWRNAWENQADEPACPFTMRPVLSDKVACIGTSQASVLAAWGNESKIEVVGVPRFDSLKSGQSKTSPANRVLVMTAKCPAYTPEQRTLLIQSLRDLKTELEQADVQVTWRLTAGLADEIDVAETAVEFTGKQLAETLGHVDAVITTPSTAMLEAMLLDLPVAVLDYTNSPSYVSSVWRISAKSHIAETVQQILNPPESKMVFQRQLLNEALYVETSATDRLHELVVQMLAIASKAAEQDIKPQFPAAMLSMPTWATSQSVGFNHKAIFPHAAFQADDSVAVKTELAHARREIEHLHREIDQLNSELSQAHEIFDEIQNHPVAGPIVRVRQRFIDLFARLKNGTSKTSQSAGSAKP